MQPTNSSLDANDLRKLKRSELLEIMLAQSEEIDRLRKELAQKDALLEDRRIAIERSGSIAEASLALTKVFEEAQKACDLYLENVAPGAVTRGGTKASGIGGVSPGSSEGTKGYSPSSSSDPSTTNVLMKGKHFSG